MSNTQIPRFKPKKPTRISRRTEPNYAVNGRIWVEKDGELFMGGGRAMLLEHIDRLGSIAAAARAMNLGYRNAWLWIEAMNRLASTPLVEKTTGGVGGGQARLTEAGRKALIDYKELRTRFHNFVSRLNEHS